MKRFALIPALFLAAALHAQRTPSISQIQPDAGLYHGGDRVTIRGTNFTSTCPIFTCPNTQVLFGSYQAEVLNVMDDEVIVRVPPHRLGVVDVTMIRPDTTRVVLKDAYTYSTGLERETVLVPLQVTDAPGANGSRWSTKLQFFNRSDHDMQLSPTDVILRPQTMIINPEKLAPAPGDTNPARLLFLERDMEDKLSTSLRLYDQARAHQTFGTELPIVHEEELRVLEIVLPEVPVRPDFRVNVRMYLTNGLGPGVHSQAFSLTAYEYGAPDSAPPLAVTTFDVWTPVIETEGGIVRPGFAQLLDIRNALPDVRRARSLRLVIRPVYPRPVVPTRYPLFWAFASVTHNESQQVTLVTPE